MRRAFGLIALLICSAALLVSPAWAHDRDDYRHYRHGGGYVYSYPHSYNYGYDYGYAAPYGYGYGAPSYGYGYVAPPYGYGYVAPYGYGYGYNRGREEHERREGNYRSSGRDRRR